MLRFLIQLFVLATVLCSFRARADEDTKRPLRIAVYELTAVDVEPRVAKLFGDSLLAELRKLQRVSVVSGDEIRALIDLEAQRQLAGCDEGSCLAEIAEALGADVLVIGGFARVNGIVALTLKRINTQTAEVVANYTQQLVDAGGEELLAAVGPAVERLFAEVPLRAGETRGVAPELALRLRPPPVPVPLFVTSSALAAVGLAATGAAGFLWAKADGDLRQSAATAKEQLLAGAVIKQQQQDLVNAQQIFLVTAAVTTGVVVITAVLAPFTDFAGYGVEQ